MIGTGAPDKTGVPGKYFRLETAPAIPVVKVGEA